MTAALESAGLETAFPIQSATIADALAGKDVLGRARTGSGKTLAFGLPAIAALAASGPATPHRPRAIVLVPTRELAMQVNDALEPYAHSMHVSIRLVAGGLSMSKQVRAIERGVHLVVATPGRLADLVRRGDADVSETRIVVLDEADHMAQMGFMDEIEEILERVPHGAQRLLFSATLDGDVDRLVETQMTDPARHDVTGGDDAPSTMRHIVLHVPPHAKYQFATRIAARQGRTIVFVRSKLGCDRIAAQMRDAGVLAIALHGDKTQMERNAAITGFRAGNIPVLVATDVAARGIHVDHVDLVMQMDPPADHKDYTHRAGRTARAGDDGLVVTLALPHQRRTVESLMERAGVDPTITVLRNADEAAFASLAKLTGAQEPSGVPVSEPALGARGARDARRPERGARSARPSRGDRGRRPSHARAAEVAPTPQHGHAKTRNELERRERELQARERELALREQRLRDTGGARSDGDSRSRSDSRSGGAAASSGGARSGGARSGRARDERAPRSREGWATKSPGGRDAWKRKGNGPGDRAREERPGRGRDGAPTREERPGRGREERGGAGRRDERPTKNWKDERPSAWQRDERPGRSRDDRRATGRGNDRGNTGRPGERASRTRDDRGASASRTERPPRTDRTDKRREGAVSEPQPFRERPDRPSRSPMDSKKAKKGKSAPVSKRSGKPRPKKKR